MLQRPKIVGIAGRLPPLEHLALIADVFEFWQVWNNINRPALLDLLKRYNGGVAFDGDIAKREIQVAFGLLVWRLEMHASFGRGGGFDLRGFLDDAFCGGGNAAVNRLPVRNLNLRRFLRVERNGRVSSGRHPILDRLGCVGIGIAGADPSGANLAIPLLIFGVVADAVDFEMQCRASASSPPNVRGWNSRLKLSDCRSDFVAPSRESRVDGLNLERNLDRV